MGRPGLAFDPVPPDPALGGPTDAPQDRATVLAWLREHPALKQPKRKRGETLSTGAPQLDRLLEGGLPRGAISEWVGEKASGRTSVALAALGTATRRGEVVAWIDPSDCLDPLSVRAAGVDLERFLWIRPSGKSILKQALRACDLVLDAGGFGYVVLDLTGHHHSMASRSAWWVRLERRVEPTDTALMVLTTRGSESFCASLRLACRRLPGAGFEVQVRIARRRGGPPGGTATVAVTRPVD